MEGGKGSQQRVDNMADLLSSPTHKSSLYDFLKQQAERDTLFAEKKVSFIKLLSQKYGEETMADGKLMSEDPNPENVNLEAEFSDDEYSNMNCLKGERVDP